MQNGTTDGTTSDAPADAAAAADTSKSGYLVLARKYRPSSFDDLIGQDVLVRTLTNAFELNRIHQAYLLTGVRGVGKTTTARILARAFNYELPARDGQPAIDRPTVDMPELGVHCQAIIESRHVDVIEMDAASHTGVGDVREIIESVRYRPVMARCKVYIIDEVHMLSNSAFNALLKTLEEPPEHVRFIFATTESDKIPVTVRSRCQRFDLRRVDSGLIAKHLAGLCEKENVDIDPEALALISRAAEGSVRDSLSLLDQAIAHGSMESGSAEGRTKVTGENVVKMLGAGSRLRIVDLFEALMKGDAAAALEIFKGEYDRGADPLLLLNNLAEYIHYVTRLKVAPGPADDVAISQEERSRGETFAKSLSVQTLTMVWQIVAKGVVDVKDSPRPLAAADMVLIRIAYASGLPSPEEVVRRLQSMPAGEGAGASSGAPGGSSGPSTRAAMGASASAGALGSASAAAAAPRQRLAAVPDAPPSPAARAHASAVPRVQLSRFEDVVALAQMRRDIQLKIALERDVRLVHFEHGKIEFSLVEGVSPAIAQQLMRRLDEWTGERWQIIVSDQIGGPSLKELSDEREQARMVGVQAHPLVQSVLEQFPGAQIVEVRMAEDNAAAPAVPDALAADVAQDEVAFEDQFSTGDDGDDDLFD
jgi:DNA polymerase-3 subunit gamma/tau